mmetsp:Transcript_88117/g.248753  ORF Transcript_88117/g.248753 Transcript_88117/m.248753 type:complete len:222 (+) Transcript_88117:35-700(+)
MRYVADAILGAAVMTLLWLPTSMGKLPLEVAVAGTLVAAGVCSLVQAVMAFQWARCRSCCCASRRGEYQDGEDGSERGVGGTGTGAGTDTGAGADGRGSFGRRGGTSGRTAAEVFEALEREAHEQEINRRRLARKQQLFERLCPAVELCPDMISGERPLEMCAVCLESQEFGEQVRFLSCGHCFHAQCLDTWWVRSPLHQLRCPMCRQRQDDRVTNWIVAV